MGTVNVLIRVYRLEIQSVMLVFHPALRTVAPLTFSLVQLAHPPRVSVQCVAGRGWVLLEAILQDFTTLYLARFRTYKILLDHSKQKPRRGGGLRQINTCRKVPVQVNSDDDILLRRLY